jgi:radical SAM/Cys-rich protein
MTRTVAGPGTFEERLAEADPLALRADSLDLLQVNIGLRCNTACSHCHQSCSPASTEMMDDATLAVVCRIAREVRPELVDITGGSPELHPGLRSLVACLRDSYIPVQVRTNLTALLDPEAEGLIDFFAERGVGLLASLPALGADEYAKQRDDGFEVAVDVLRRLNAAGWGTSERLPLHIAVNPCACDLYSTTAGVEARYRSILTGELGVRFDRIVLITNMPVGRFRTQLERTGEFEAYLEALSGEERFDLIDELERQLSA